MHDHGLGLGGSKPAVKIPKIDAFRQIAAPFAFDVLADFMFDRFENAVPIFTFDIELECFFHGVIMRRKPKLAGYPAHC